MTALLQFLCIAALCSVQLINAGDSSTLVIKQMPAYFLYDNPKDVSLRLSDFKSLVLATSGVSIHQVRRHTLFAYLLIDIMLLFWRQKAKANRL